MRSHLFIVGIAVVLLFSNGQSTTAAETMWNLPGGGNWLDPASWSLAVPGAGDTAIFGMLPDADAIINLDGPVSVGSLDIANEHLLTFGGGPLSFDTLDPGTAATIRLTGNQGRVMIDADWNPLSDLDVDGVEGSQLTFIGSLLGGNARLTKNGAGTLQLAGDNSAWSGEVVLNEGIIIVNHAGALGTSADIEAEATVVNEGGRLTFASGTFAPERILLNGGTLAAQGSLRIDSESPAILSGNIELLADSQIAGGGARWLEITGEIGGSGGLWFSGVSPPDFAPRFNLIFVRGPTSYSGETVIGPDTFVAFQHPESLGDSSAGTRVLSGGSLALYGGEHSEHIDVEEGRLLLVGGSAYNHNIVLRRGALAGVDGGGLLNTPLQLDGGGQLGLESADTYIVLPAGIVGTGSLQIINRATLSGPTSFAGDLVISHRGEVNVTAPLQHDGATILTGGTLTLSGSVTPQDGSLFVTGRENTVLRVNAANSIEELILDPRPSTREGFVERYQVDVLGSLEVTSDLRFFGGKLRGQFTGQTTLTKRSRLEGWLENSENSSFEEILVEEGTLHVVGPLGAGVRDLRLGSSPSSRLRLDNIGTFSGDIHLNNVQGGQNDAALHTQGNTMLAGDVHLGDIGGTINGADISGSIHGGALRKIGSFDLTLRGDGHTYVGPTEILGGKLILADDARLETTPLIHIDGRHAGGGASGHLVLDSRGARDSGDRVRDSIPITMAGGRLELIGRDATASSETVGALAATRGYSEIMLQNGSGVGSQSTLSINEIQRNPGATVNFIDDGPDSRIRISTPPALDDNILGGWALVGGNDFATYGPDGVVAYSSLHAYVSSLNAAGPADNVSTVDEAITLNGDRNINALRFHRADINLNGHTLNLESGGLLAPPGFFKLIRGGALTAGGSGDGELIISAANSVLNLDADIVDNTGGSVALTATGVGGGEVVLRGKNRYSGPTTINDSMRLRVTSPDSLPPNSDVVVNGGDLILEFDSADTVDLGVVEMRNAGRLLPETGTRPVINADSYVLETSTIEVGLTGDGPLTKTGFGTAVLLGDSSSYTGTIDVQQGTFLVDGLSLLGGPPGIDHAIFVRSGGTLTLDDIFIAERTIVLDGGTLSGEVRGGTGGTIDVRSNSTIRGGRGIFNIVSDILGDGDLLLDGPFFNGQLIISGSLGNFQGNLQIAGGNVRILSEEMAENATINIVRDGVLDVAQPLTAKVALTGGALNFAPSQGISPVLVGETTVAENSQMLLSASTTQATVAIVEGSVRLENGSELRIRPVSNNLIWKKELDERGKLSFPGDLIVDGTATITSYDNAAELSGVIIPASPAAVLNLRGADTIVMEASVHVPAGRSLTVQRNGQSAPLEISGPRKLASGNGTIANDLIVTAGAAIAPGDSAGLLTIDGDAVIGEVGRFVVEIGGPLRGVDYDALDVLGEATLEGLLFVSMLDDFSPALGETFDVLFADGGIDGTLSMLTTFPSFDGRTLEARYSANNLQLEVVIDMCIAGDTAPCDGTVDIDDLNNVRNQFGTGAGIDRSGISGDTVPFDGLVDIDDVNNVRNQFGSTLAAAVPEPASVVAALLSALLLSLTRSSHCRYPHDMAICGRRDSADRRHRCRG